MINETMFASAEKKHLQTVNSDLSESVCDFIQGNTYSSLADNQRNQHCLFHSELKEKALESKKVRDAYDALEPEFSLLHEILRARQNAGLSQAEIAERMGTKAPAVTRLESSLSSGKHSPSISILKKYADALNCHLEIKLVANS
ncbi:MAG: helix-turn-helix transcriptional regulator [Candidatus Fermentibacteria bacterium]|nr:helix-turn-helix transcriptional regulator [Candidatus Fermentibacteria bacterium]